MQRLHLHISVNDLDQGIRFYSALLGSEPSKCKQDYAQWLLDDPRLNLAISTRGTQTGLDHLGIQADGDDELGSLRQRLQSADMALFNEGETVCCYARSDKSWVEDPAGLPWEVYHTMAEAETFSAGHEDTDNSGACCAPRQNGCSQ